MPSWNLFVDEYDSKHAPYHVHGFISAENCL